VGVSGSPENLCGEDSREDNVAGRGTTIQYQYSKRHLDPLKGPPLSGKVHVGHPWNPIRMNHDSDPRCL